MDEDTQLFTLTQIYNAWFDYWENQRAEPRYINVRYEHFKKHLMQHL